MDQRQTQVFGGAAWAALKGYEPAGAGYGPSPSDAEIIDAVWILKRACHGAAVRAGWWHDLETGESLIGQRNIPEMLMLAVSELAEVMEGYRKSLPSEKLPGFSAFEEEAADVFIRMFDTMGATGVRIAESIVAKLAYNAVRLDHRPENRRKAGGKSF